MSDSRKSKKFRITVISLICTAAVLAGAGGTLYYFDVQRHQQNISNAVKEVPLAELPELVIEPNYDPNRPVYEPSGKFTVNTSKFSDKIYKNLIKDVRAEYSVLYDMTTDEILFEENADKKCYPASTTKLLTAIVATKIITDPDTVITVGNEIKMIGEESSTAGLKIGMKLTFSDLMDAMMLPSGNDAAYAMAVNCSRIYKNDPKMSNKDALNFFVELMNEAAQQLGAVNSKFVNPDGWHSPNHYTTAKDLAKISAYAKSVPIIAKSCSTHYAERELVKGGTMYWVNGNLMLNDYYNCYSKFCDGLKTGFTDEAGSCIISSATVDDHVMIAVIMDGYDGYAKYDDANLLFTRGYKLYRLSYRYGVPNSQAGKPRLIS